MSSSPWGNPYLLIIICLLFLAGGFFAGFAYFGGDSKGPANLTQPGISATPSQSSINVSESEAPDRSPIVTDIVILESQFVQAEQDVEEIVGTVKNIGNETYTGFQIFANVTDQSKGTRRGVGYVTDGITFAPDQTRDFLIIISNANNLSVIEDYYAVAWKE